MGHAPAKVPGTEAAVVVTCSTRTYREETGAPIENKTAIGSTGVGGCSAWSQTEEPKDRGHTWPPGL